MNAFATVPNQRVITIHKETCNSANKYTTNNLVALDEAAFRLQSKGGFKLYMYLAKNQDKFSFALSSTDFCAWSGIGLTAYRSAFEELVNQGYLILKENTKNVYTFYDKAQIDNNNIIDNVIIEIPKETIEHNNKFIF